MQRRLRASGTIGSSTDMTTRIGNRFALSRIASVAMAETRLAARATPSVVRRLAPIVAWAAVAIGLGVLVGFAAVVLPPMGAFGIVAVVAVVLLWAMPEAPVAYPALIRKAFLVMLVVNLCVPYNYMIQVGDLPWISARRITAFALIAPFLLALASSSEIRRSAESPEFSFRAHAAAGSDFSLLRGRSSSSGQFGRR